MQKRGMLVLWLIIELVLSFFIMYSLISLAKGLGTQQFFVKQALAEESALIVQALQNVPGNVVLQHPSDTSLFVVHLKDNKIIVEDRRNREASFFGSAKNNIVKNSKTIYFYKNGGEVSISANVPTLSQLTCIAQQLERSTLRIEATGDEQSIARTLGFKCSERLCASSEQSQGVTLAIQNAKSGVSIHFTTETRNIACNIFNKLTAKDNSILTWLVPGSTFHIDVAPEHRTAIATALGDAS